MMGITSQLLGNVLGELADDAGRFGRNESVTFGRRDRTLPISIVNCAARIRKRSASLAPPPTCSRMKQPNFCSARSTGDGCCDQEEER